MTDTVTLPEARPSSGRIDPGDLFHLFCCCDQNLGLCGADLTDVPLAELDDETACPMCFDLEDEPCARCGCTDCEVDG